MRRLQDLQVTIEVRFITLNDNFFERIGVNFDFDIKDNVAARASRSACELRRASGTAAAASDFADARGIAGRDSEQHAVDHRRHESAGHVLRRS